jgi:DNA modification methylase
MSQVTFKVADLKEIPEFRSLYTPQSIESLRTSIGQNGQLSPIHITEDGHIIDGYARYDVLRELGIEEVSVVVHNNQPTLYDRITLNQYRQKTTVDVIAEIKYAFKRFPKKQGQRVPGTKYSRAELIAAATGGRFKSDKTINKLEEVVENDLPNEILLKGIVEKGWKTEACHEFVTETRKIDEENKYGYTEMLTKGVININDANKLIKNIDELSRGVEYTFKIPEKGNAYNANCLDLGKMEEHQGVVDLILTSPPYYILRKYQNGDPSQLGQEETAKEYCEGLAKILNGLVPTLKQTANVMINIGETYDDGVGYGIPQLLKQAIEENTPLIYKDTLVWSKPNPKPQNETVLRPINNVEYILWFVVDPNVAKYKLLTYPVEGKKPKFSKGARDIDKYGNVWANNVSISKPYGKIYSHLKEQEVQNIIQCTVGCNHEVYKVSKEGHPAIMSSTLPVVPILMTTDESDVVLDPFSGSNVVGRMSLLLNRKFLSAELSRKYFKIGCELLRRSNEEFNRRDLEFIQSIVYEQKDEEQKIAA